MIDIVNNLVVPLLKAILATMLITAGAAKFADLRSFNATLVGLSKGVWSNFSTRILTLLIPLTELSLGFLLLVGIWLRLVSIAVLFLFTFFTLVTGLAILKRPNVTCRCFGALTNSQFNIKGLIRSILLTGSAIIVVWNGLSQSQAENIHGSVVLLLCGYGILAVAVAQAARTLGAIKERSRP